MLGFGCERTISDDDFFEASDEGGGDDDELLDDGDRIRDLEDDL